MAKGLTKRQQVAIRRAKALDMRRAGKPYRAIADELEYASESAASRDVHRALQGAVMEAGRNLLTLERERTDAVQAQAWALACDTNLSPRDRVAAIREVTRVLERRARLLGLDKAAGELLAADSMQAAKGLMADFVDHLRQEYADLPHD